MSLEVVETPVETLVLGDDRTGSRVMTIEVVTARKEERSASHLNLMDDDEDEAEDEEVGRDLSTDAVAVASKSAESETSRAEPQEGSNPPVNVQNQSVQEPDQVQSVATTSTFDGKVEQTRKEIPAEEVASAEVVGESPRQQVTKPEQEALTAATPALLQDFLYHKIIENQCSSHAKEILEFLSSHVTESQVVKIVPQVILNLSQHFQNEAEGNEVSVDIQTSLCLVEQMLLPAGRRSPLQDMYTAEEEELLNQLANIGGSIKNVLSVLDRI